jgi:hypothetical protein
MGGNDRGFPARHDEDEPLGVISFSFDADGAAFHMSSGRQFRPWTAA